MKEQLPPFLTQYWPFLVFIAFIAFRFHRNKKVREEIRALGDPSTIQFVDVRSEAEFLSSGLPQSKNIPLQSVSTRSDELDKSKPVVVFCASGTRSGVAKGIFVSKGFSKVINGGSLNNVRASLQ